MCLTTVATRLGDRCGLVAFDRTVRAVLPARSGRDQLGRVAEAMFDLEPVLAESDYRGAFTHALARFRRRSLIVLFTDLVEQAVGESLLPALPLLVRHHIVLIAAVRDPDVVGWATAPPGRRRRRLPRRRRHPGARRARPRHRPPPRPGRHRHRRAPRPARPPARRHLARRHLPRPQSPRRVVSRRRSPAASSSELLGGLRPAALTAGGSGVGGAAPSPRGGLRRSLCPPHPRRANRRTRELASRSERGLGPRFGHPTP